MNREWIFSTIIILGFVVLNAWEDLYQWARFTINGQIFFGTIITLAIIITYVWLSENNDRNKS